MKNTKTVVVLALLAAGLAGCSTPALSPAEGMVQHDKDTSYSVRTRPEGFFLTISYSHYQFFPDENAVAGACRSALTSIAWEIADKVGKKIQPINEQRVRISIGRNGLTGVTSCSASTPVVWAEGRPHKSEGIDSLRAPSAI